jgi:integrase
MEQNHLHKYKEDGNYYVCECGKKILKFNETDGVKIAMRKNGRKYSKKSDPNRFFFPKEYIKFEDSLKPKQKHTARCLINTGARIDEMQNVKVEDFIYNESGRSTINLRKTKTKARKGEFGSGKPRNIPISKQFARYLFNYIKENNLQDMDKINILSTPATKIFMKIAAQKIGLRHPEDFSAHTFRKTFEVWLMAKGVGDMSVIAHLGHDLKTAVSHYVSPDVLSWDDRKLIDKILGDLYER